MTAVTSPVIRAGTLDPRRWKALALLAVAQFVVVLDATIVNIALPSVGRDLHASTGTLSWVINAYVLAFGGLLLFGGRLADLLGRRRLFVVGLALFGLASLAGGLSTSITMLITARAVQGTGAALLAPAALSLVTTLFPSGAERNKALGIWGAVAGSGSAVGVLLGGVLTTALGWEWVLFINVPVTAAAVAVTPRLLDESRAARGRIDVAGAFTVVGATVAGVYALVRANTVGWLSAQTIGLLVLAVALGVAFVVVESRVAEPLVTLGIFRERGLRAANLSMVAIGAVTVGLFFFLSLYLQQMLGYDALRAGLSQLPLAAVLVAVAGVAGPLVERHGVRSVLVPALAVLAGGVGWLSREPVHGSYLADVLGPTLLIGVGLGAAFVAVTIGSVASVDERRYGLASGLINTSQQIGGALGLAVLTAVADTRVGNAGYDLALLVGAGIAVLAMVVAAVTTPKREITQAG